MDVTAVDFRAMGCAARVVVVGDAGTGHAAGAALVDHAVSRVARLESLWSRFLPDSDISRINAAGGAPVEVDPTTVTLVTRMVEAWHATSGLYDPTLVGALVGLGYATSWEDPTRRSAIGPDIARRGDVAGIVVHPDAGGFGRGVVRVPFSTALDAGGIGKGLAADLVAGELLERGATGALVSIGGDLRVTGIAPQDGGWAVGIDDPLAGADPSTSAPIAQVRLLDGGVATSGTNRRRWRHDGRTVHHLLDPATGRPADRRDEAGRMLVSASVIAGTGASAEAWTKALMVAGPTALDRLETLGLAAMVVHDDASTLSNAAWDRFCSIPVGPAPHGRDSRP